jgi:hypothetical protein
MNLQSAHVTTTSLSTNRKQGTPMPRFPVVSLKRLILGTWSPRALSRHLASLRKLPISVRIIGPGCGMSEPRGITQAGVIAAHSITASMPGMDTSTAILGMTAHLRMLTRVGIDIIVIEGANGALSPLVAAEASAHSRLSKL